MCERTYVPYHHRHAAIERNRSGRCETKETEAIVAESFNAGSHLACPISRFYTQLVTHEAREGRGERNYISHIGGYNSPAFVQFFGLSLKDYRFCGARMMRFVACTSFKARVPRGFFKGGDIRSRFRQHPYQRSIIVAKGKKGVGEETNACVSVSAR